MGNLVYATDVHLNFVHTEKIKSFCRAILKKDPTAIAIGGDISEAPELEHHLRVMERHLDGVPLYFVCGNHDYYKGSVKYVRGRLQSQFKAGNVIWLPNVGITTLAPGAAIVGHDGWYDGGYPDKNGDWFNSKLDMNDYYLIQELSSPVCVNRRQKYERIQRLSKEGADHFRTFVPKAFENHDKVFYVTHVSPFAESSRAPDGSMSGRDWMPHFCSKQSGDAIMDVMTKQPAEKKLIVLCGHSHTHALYRPLPNVHVYVGPAQYRKPKVAEQFKY